ncbi:MAG: SDR family oxidoreductase, partial [Thermoguttaceae bacterium]|nr:SDR family oxidoreductase [Thermoguttaceae bacterium]
RIGRKLVEGLRNPTVVEDSSALDAFSIHPRGLREAITRAIIHEDQAFAATRWSDAVSSSGLRARWGGVRFGSRIVDSRAAVVPAPPEAAFAPIQRIGGQTGWYYANGLWRLRGLLDLLGGGVGLRRGRRDPVDLRVGDVLDFWRVEAFESNHLLRLQAEMKLPGRAWLEFEVTPAGDGSTIRQTAVFDPLGLSGLAYWYGLYPLHRSVFAGMLKALARAAETSAQR